MTIEIRNYLFKLFFLLASLLVLLLLFSSNSSPLSSFFSGLIIFFLATNIAIKLFIGKLKWNIILSLIFIFKIIVGVYHYLYFIDSSYFIHGNYNAMTYEYAAVYQNLIESSNHKNIYGITSYLDKQWGVTHRQLWSIISIPFIFLGNYFMSINPINAFASIFTSINIYIISKSLYKLNKKQYEFILLVSALFPLSFITSLLWRDIVGLCFISIGLTLVTISRNKAILKFIFVLVACYLCYLQRNIYPLAVIISYFLTLNIFKNSFNGISVTINVITVALLIVLIYFFGNDLILSLVQADDLKKLSTIEPLAFVFKFIIGIIGPFPWDQIFLHKAFTYQLQEFFQAAINISLIFALIKNRGKVLKLDNLNFVNIISILFIIIGLINPDMHMSYVAIGFIFLIPIISKYISFKTFIGYFTLIFIFLYFINIIYIVLLGELGFSTFWK